MERRNDRGMKMKRNIKRAWISWMIAVLVISLSITTRNPVIVLIACGIAAVFDIIGVILAHLP